MSERIVEEKSDGKLINQLMQLQAGLRIGAARLSAQRTHAPLIWAFLSVRALTFPQTRAQSCAPPCRDEEMRVRRESVRPSCWRRGRGDADLFAKQLIKKEQQKNARKTNKQNQSSLFISVLWASSSGLLSPVPAGERAARGWGISLCASWAEMWERSCA